MPVQVFTDYDGRRVLLRNLGPAGPGLIPGGTVGQIYVKASNADYDGAWANSPSGTGAAVGPASSVNGNFVLFDGTTGKLLKDSTFAVSYFATKSYADSKLAIDGVKVLSDVNYSFADKAKVDSLSTGGFRGSYATEIEIDDIVDPLNGDRAYLEVLGEDVVEYLYDSVNALWFPQSLNPLAMTGQEIANVLFETVDAAAWDKENCQVYTSAEKEALALLAGGGSGFQPVDATLTALAGLTTLADKIPYFTGVDAVTTTDFTASGRNLVGAVSVVDQRTVLGVGTTDTPQFNGIKITSGVNAKAGNLTLVAGTVTIANSGITSTDIILLSRKTVGGTVGQGGYIYTLNPGVGFTVTSVGLTGTLVNTDTSVISYEIITIV